MDAIQRQSTNWASHFRTRSMLIVEDDERLMQRLARAMEDRGFQVVTTGFGV
jgi:ActR/RegA family two-component response regulator